MRGPIDYIIVSFDGNNFNGSVLKSLKDAIDKKIIALVALSVVSKDANGAVTTLDIAQLKDEYIIELTESESVDKDIINQEDIDEVGELLENNTTAGLLAVEQLWAKPLKQALIDANGTLIAEGRIHPEAAQELN